MDKSSKYYPDGIRGIEYINGIMKVIGVDCKGKYIFIKVQDANNNIYYIYNHLGMEGKWLKQRKWLNTGNSHSNLWITIGHNLNGNIFENVFDFYFDDVRHYGKFEILSEDQYINKLNGIGPDMLSDDVSFEIYYNKVQDIMSRTKTLNLAEFLLKQNYFSGVGNYLKSEILYQAKLNPFRNISSLNQNEIYAMYSKSIELINQAYNMGGMTIKSFINPFGNINGGFIPMIYGKSIDPYSNNIESSNKKGNTKTRMTYWVPSIQI